MNILPKKSKLVENFDPMALENLSAAMGDATNGKTIFRFFKIHVYTQRTMKNDLKTATVTKNMISKIVSRKT